MTFEKMLRSCEKCGPRVKLNWNGGQPRPKKSELVDVENQETGSRSPTAHNESISLFHRNARLEAILTAIVDAGTRNGWMTSQVNVAERQRGKDSSVIKTLPVLDLTSWETNSTESDIKEAKEESASIDNDSSNLSHAGTE